MLLMSFFFASEKLLFRATADWHNNLKKIKYRFEFELQRRYREHAANIKTSDLSQLFQEIQYVRNKKYVFLNRLKAT